MERASQALVAMDYLTCESLCVEALAEARRAQQWDTYARILMPLQESRRQRRMIAAEGAVRLGTGGLSGDASSWLGGHTAACIVVTHPHHAASARALHDAARRDRLHVEVLYADNTTDADTWRLTSFAGPAVVCEVAAPPADWRDKWIGHTASDRVKQPADWFIDATEALGDAALEQVATLTGSVERIDELEARLAAADDHEILHQRLAEAARAAAQGET